MQAQKETQMPKPFNPHLFDNMLRGEHMSRHPSSRQITRIMDRFLTAQPRASGRKQHLVEMEIRDEIARRRGNRFRWPRF
jgi:hypothetical protein